MNVIQLPAGKIIPSTPTTVIPIGISGVSDIQFLVDSAEFLGQPLQVVLTYLSFVGATWTYDLESGNLTNNAHTIVAEYYNPTANYSLIETILTDPVMYEAELLLNILDINAFDNFVAVKIDELEGIFYVNKITESLITSPGIPTKVELIKIS